MPVAYSVKKIIPITAALTITKDLPYHSGTVFSNKGATGSVTFTLPAANNNTAGCFYEFHVVADQTLIVAGAASGKIVAPNNATADNVSYAVASRKIGGRILAYCNGASWVCFGLPTAGFCINGTEVSPALGGLGALTATIAELNKLAGVTGGTTTASKALVVDANKALDALVVAALSLGAGAGTAVTATATELNVLAGVTPGTAQLSKGVVLDANKAIDANFLVKLGAAVTVQSPPLVGLPADVVGAASGTVQSTFYPLSSITIPANALSVNGKGFEFTFAGTTAANANNKDFRLHFGAATPTLTTANAGNAQPFLCYGAIYRTAAGAQVVVAQLVIGTASPIPIVTTATADETTAWTFSIESQNTAAAAASATGKFGQVTFQN